MSSLSKNADYKEWIIALKKKIQSVQIKAAVQVNTELLRFYWELGAEIVEKQKQADWGDGFIGQLSRDLSSAFPGLKGFSSRNLMYIKKWYLFYSEETELVQQAVAIITQIPWGHNLVIITKIHNITEALFYIQSTIENSWSRSVLTHQIEGGLYGRQGKAISNDEFKSSLPSIEEIEAELGAGDE